MKWLLLFAVVLTVLCGLGSSFDHAGEFGTFCDSKNVLAAESWRELQPVWSPYGGSSFKDELECLLSAKCSAPLSQKRSLLRKKSGSGESSKKGFYTGKEFMRAIHMPAMFPRLIQEFETAVILLEAPIAARRGEWIHPEVSECATLGCDQHLLNIRVFVGEKSIYVLFNTKEIEYTAQLCAKEMIPYQGAMRRSNSKTNELRSMKKGESIFVTKEIKKEWV
eukprot:Lankesteria_metandrocarpae@DN4087_c1_g1_i1.p1